jgi:hypothetical protein
VSAFRGIGNYLKQRYTKAKFVNYYDGELRQGNDARTRQLAVFSKKQLGTTKIARCRKSSKIELKNHRNRQIDTPYTHTHDC